MIALEPVDRLSATTFKAVRLNALRDSPFAFGSTYDKESQLTDVEWENRAAERDGTRSITYLAWDDSQACGIAAGFIDVDDPAAAHLVSVWVTRNYRGRGVGRSLVAGVAGWAKGRQVQTLKLMVTSNNPAALAFYEHLGFHKTGRTEPYPNDPAVIEFEMAACVEAVLEK